jgi:hypothetical protein
MQRQRLHVEGKATRSQLVSTVDASHLDSKSAKVDDRENTEKKRRQRNIPTAESAGVLLIFRSFNSLKQLNPAASGNKCSSVSSDSSDEV